LSDDGIKGPVETQEIEMLANRAWRRGMLWAIFEFCHAF
jgi:hypothetical protein